MITSKQACVFRQKVCAANKMWLRWILSWQKMGLAWRHKDGREDITSLMGFKRNFFFLNWYKLIFFFIWFEYFQKCQLRELLFDYCFITKIWWHATMMQSYCICGFNIWCSFFLCLPRVQSSPHDQSRPALSRPLANIITELVRFVFRHYTMLLFLKCLATVNVKIWVWKLWWVNCGTAWN